MLLHLQRYLYFIPQTKAQLGEWAHWNLDDSSGLDNVSSRNLSVTGSPSIDNGSWSLAGNHVYGEYQLNSNDNLDNFSISIRVRICLLYTSDAADE